MFIGANLGEGPDEPLSKEEIDKRLAVRYESEERMYAEWSKIMARYAISREKSLKEKRKPLGMPDDKPKRSSPKSED